MADEESTYAPHAGVEDLEAGWRALTPLERGVAATLLERASRRLDAFASTTDAELLKDAACEMVRHAFESGRQGIGLDTGEYRLEAFGADTVAGDLWLTGDTKALVGWGEQMIVTIPLAGMPLDEEDAWTSL